MYLSGSSDSGSEPEYPLDVFQVKSILIYIRTLYISTLILDLKKGTWVDG